MTRPTLPVLYPVNWTGFIGTKYVTITEVRLMQGTFKKAVPAKLIT